MDESKEQNAPTGDKGAGRRHTDRDDASTPCSANETSRRIANLLFLFSSTRHPIPTEEIVFDSDLGYGSGNPDSDKRKFRRDRDALAARGCFIVQANEGVTAENEDARWMLDRSRTYADLPSLPLDDLLTLIHAIDVQLTASGMPYRATLRRVREKLAQAAVGTGRGGAEDVGETPRDGHDGQDTIGAALWTAFAAHLCARFTYQDAQGRSREREIEQYGFFELDGTPYMVGRDRKREGETIRTFNLNRVRQVRAPKGRYTIPDGFDIRSHINHPFDISGAGSVEASFLIPRTIAAAERERITLGKGLLEPLDNAGGFRWTIGVQSIEKAARFAIERGIDPLSPTVLVGRWETMLDRAVKSHA